MAAVRALGEQIQHVDAGPLVGVQPVGPIESSTALSKTTHTVERRSNILKGV
jgi:hypothetical protein